MSTYNGRKHLRQQIDSVLAQTDVEVRLVVRDDGSTDETLAILEEYACDPRVIVRQGDNLGLPGAYFRLIEESDGSADYWALADQDDVWLPHKLAVAVRRLSLHEGPVLYCARVHVVDEALRPLYRHPLPRRGPSLDNALVQNIATGCTIVVNRDAREALRGRWPASAVMHDAWLYLVLTAVGAVVYDPQVVVLYRQHHANAVGMGRGRTARVAGRVRRQLSTGGAGAHGRQNRSLLDTHWDLLPPRVAAEIQGICIADARQRIVIALRGKLHRQSRGSSAVLRILIALGRL